MTKSYDEWATSSSPFRRRPASLCFWSAMRRSRSAVGKVLWQVESSFLLTSDLMLATTSVWHSKTSNLVEVMVPKFTATFPLKKSLTSCSVGAEPGGEIANANWAIELTLLSMMASVSSVLRPAFSARSRRAAVECTSDAASRWKFAMAVLSVYETRTLTKMLLNCKQWANCSHEERRTGHLHVVVLRAVNKSWLAPNQTVLKHEIPVTCAAGKKELWLELGTRLTALANGHELSIVRKHLLHLRLSRNGVLTMSLCSAVAFIPHLKVQVSLSASAWTILLISCWNML